MRIGISVCSSYTSRAAREDHRLGARFMIERARAARDADLDSLFVGDHHVTPTPYYQNTPMLRRMLAEWHNKPAGALYLLPLWHPVVLAEHIATLACIMEGRFIMQCGLGGDVAQSNGLGIDMSRRVAMFEDYLNILRALWAGETVDHDRFWPLQGARINPLPPQEIEVWIGSVAPPAINRTARMAQGWLASPSLNLTDATKQLNQYRQACAEHGRTPTAVALRRDVYVGATSQEAGQVRDELLQRGYRGFGEDAMLCGSVDQVVEELGQFAAVGYTDVIVRNMSQDQGQALATIERLGDVKRQLDL